MTILLTFEGKTPAQLRKIYDPDIIQKALITAMNRATMKTRTEVSQKVRSIYDIKAGDISKRVSIRKQQHRDIVRYLLYRGPAEGLEKFKPRGKNIRVGTRRLRGVTVRVRKDRGRKLVKGGFLAAISGTKVFKRKGLPRLPIRKLVGPSVPHMVGKKLVVVAAQDKFHHEVDIEFDRAMQFHLSKVR